VTFDASDGADGDRFLHDTELDLSAGMGGRSDERTNDVPTPPSCGTCAIDPSIVAWQRESLNREEPRTRRHHFDRFARTML
jgi:hypothetical protein